MLSRYIAGDVETAPNQPSLSASPRRNKFTIVGMTILPDRVQMPGGRGCRGS